MDLKKIKIQILFLGLLICTPVVAQDDAPTPPAADEQVSSFLQIGHYQALHSVCWTADSAMLTSYSSVDGWIMVWNVQSGQLLWKLKAALLKPKVPVQSPVGVFIATGEKNFELREPESGKVLWTMKYASATPERYSSPDGSMIAEEVSTLMFSPDDKLIASGYDDSTIKLWDVKSNKLRRILKGRFKELSAVVFSPDGKFLAAGYNTSDTRVEIWSVQSGRLVMRLGKDSDYVESISFGRDGLIATGHFWDDVRVWNTKTGRVVKSFKQPFSEDDHVAFSPDGKYLVSGGWNQNVLLWNLRQGKLTWSALPLDWETDKRIKEGYHIDNHVRRRNPENRRG